MEDGTTTTNRICKIYNGHACMTRYPKKEIAGESIWDWVSTACILQQLGFLATNFENGKSYLKKTTSSRIMKGSIILIFDDDH